MALRSMTETFGNKELVSLKRLTPEDLCHDSDIEDDLKILSIFAYSKGSDSFV